MSDQPRAVLRSSRDKIVGVVAAYREQYRNLDMLLWDGRRPREILAQLEALDLRAATHEDVAAIIGNSGWTTERCGSCGEYVDTYVHLGEEPDYESTTFFICEPCLRFAASLLPPREP